MLKISGKQQAALTQAADDLFLNEMQLRLRERVPDLTGTLDDEQLNVAVTAAVEAAKTYGFNKRGPVRLYLDLCVSFGSGFVDDPVYDWAAKAIGDADPDTQMDRSEALYSKSLEALSEINGTDGAHGLAALRALKTWANQTDQLPELNPAFAVQQMHQLHPEKAQHAGDEALQQLFDEARNDCAEFGTQEARPIMLTTALKFGFGSGCLCDPFYPWIGATLSKENVPVVADRFKRLERKALTWVNAILNKAPGG